MKRFLHFLFFLFLCKFPFAQKLSSLVTEGNKAIENKDYYLATALKKQLVLILPIWNCNIYMPKHAGLI